MVAMEMLNSIMLSWAPRDYSVSGLYSGSRYRVLDSLNSKDTVLWVPNTESWIP